MTPAPDLASHAEKYIRMFKGDPKVHSLALETLVSVLTQVRKEALEALAKQTPNANQILMLGLLSGAGPQSRDIYIDAYNAVIAEAVKVATASPKPASK